MLTIGPAYGRDYRSRREVETAWRAGKDFVILSFGPDSGRYVSTAELAEGEKVAVRYGKLTKVFILTNRKGEESNA